MKSGKTKIEPVPEGFTPANVRVESSVCTGEKTIGFYSAADGRLHYAQLVRTQADIDGFYRRYGIQPKNSR